VQSVTNDTFGPLVAYLVPGATVLFGLSPFSPTLQAWLAASAATAPTIGGFLYLTVAAIATGMVVSAIRWALIDRLHAWTGLPPPSLNFARLGENVEAFELLIEIHYRHYQHFSNMFVATLIAYICHRVAQGHVEPLGLLDLGFVALEVVFFAASRDTIRKYFRRSEDLLGSKRTRDYRRPARFRKTSSGTL
jgi:hypothetical protein